ncbi:histone-lysine N-methyltransferase NSD3 isoform X1 [Pelobates cultripes]|uniref:Histone-lysine N-methyltransferase NSD3 n=1 Tax=Pelobates cultripes TaxID=61616 RepID=A0AAD1VZI2_PELCU|nr:histone-lysine N-methyltransferase NSD3 isoform X1 [Pelobates cultripes]
MDFSFSFMQGIMGNTIQQPPQLIDSANNRQDDANSSDQADEGGHTPYDSGLQPDFQYPTPTTEDLPPLTNGYQPSLGYEPQGKYQTYSQFPNGSANGYGTRNFTTLEYYPLDTAAMRPHEGLVKTSPTQPTSPPSLHQYPPFSTTTPQKKTGSPEIKLRITKTIQNGREMFESSLCGDLLHEFQASEYTRKKHERRRERREKRKKSSRHHHHHHHRGEVNFEEQQPQKILKLEPQEEEIVQQSMPVSPLSSEVRTGVWFHVGDLVWSKVGTYPWWPCMVSCDPQLHVHSKINTRGAREYHVQFFSNEPERAWIHEKRMREYRGQKQYEQLLAEDAAKAVNQSDKLKMRKPRPQKERVQWEIGIAHAEKALRMTREERIEQYTFIYIDQETSPEPKKSVGTCKRSRRSTSSSEAEHARPSDVVSSPPKQPAAPATTLSPLQDIKDSSPEPRRQSQRKLIQETDQQSPPQPQPQQQTPPPPPPPQPAPAKTAWKTAAARKSIPASVLLHKGTLDLQKCNMSPVVKIENVLALHNATSEGFDQFIYTTKDVGNKTEITVKAAEKVSAPSPIAKTEKTSAQHTPAPESSSGATVTGTSEKKHQRRSNRTRSESEKSMDFVPKKKIKKEQVEESPLTAVQIGLQKGASEISDSCKPLKKRSRASTDVELANSSYRDASDSDSRGNNDTQICFEKQSDSPSAAVDADASDVQSVDSSTSRRSSRRDTVCQICECFGESLVSCDGECARLFHLECLGMDALPDGGKFVCMECKTGNHTCFSCKLPSTSVKRCSVASCSKFYHETCARLYAATVFDSKGFRCPHHCCSSCTADKDTYRANKGRMLCCVRCPVAYHSGDSCVAAGCHILSSSLIICSNHSKRSGHSSCAVNVGFCFVCARGLIVQEYSLVSSMSFKSHFLLTDSKRAELMKIPMIPSSSPAFIKKSEKGGKLLCCESCPAAFHPSCLNMEMPQGSWSCNDCRTGKKLHYKQIVWVKLGNYRWWPAEICNPRSVPLNIQGLKHDIGDFPVFFFGSHDYYWVHQGRVFPYVEGDKSFAEGQTSINKTFKKALEEAAKRFQELKAQRESKEAIEVERNSRKPPPYKHIKSNKAVGKVQIQLADISEIPRCNCRPSDEAPCGLESQCLNRMLQYECHPQVCPAGEQCQNQSFTKRLYPETEIIRTDKRGWGLKTKKDIRKGEFVNEYVGELIDEEECRLRMKRAHETGITNFYMLTITKDRIIDAGPKGNYSRFINHSCNPNCETQKWTVNGDIRVGLFALCDIPQGTELTFNYNLDCLGNGRTECHCGEENCSGFLGVRPKTACATATEEKAKNARLKAKKRKIKTEQKQMHEDFCFRCGDGGELVMCDKKDCPKAYHLLCLNLTQPPYGKWDCPWHQCDICGANSSSFCDFCPASFCKEHEKGALKVSAVESRLCCSEHDPKCPLACGDRNKIKCKTEHEDPLFPQEF